MLLLNKILNRCHSLDKLWQGTKVPAELIEGRGHRPTSKPESPASMHGIFT